MHNRFRWRALALALALALSLQGCATIFHGSSQTIAVATDPADAMVRVGGNTFRSPAQVTLRRDADYIVTAEKEGYDTGQGTVTHSVHWPTFLGNIIFGGLIGWAIDFSSGSAYKLEPDNLTVPMKAKATKSEGKEAAPPK